MAKLKDCIEIAHFRIGTACTALGSLPPIVYWTRPNGDQISGKQSGDWTAGQWVTLDDGSITRITDSGVCSYPATLQICPFYFDREAEKIISGETSSWKKYARIFLNVDEFNHL